MNILPPRARRARKRSATGSACRERRLEQFNRRVAPGTPVRFWPAGIDGPGRQGRTVSAAWLLQGHTAVVLVESWCGLLAVSHVQPEA